MSKGQTLRVLVTERLTAAAEEIFALFEKVIAEFEAELRRSKRNNPRKRIRDSALSLSTSPGPGLNQDPPRVKEEPEEPEPEEPRVRPEGHALLHQRLTRTDPDPEGAAPISVGVPESSATCVKTEESPLLPQRQTEPREDTQGGDISAKPHSPSKNFYDMDQEKDPCTNLRSQTSGPKHKSAPETLTTVNSGATSGTAEGTEAKKHQCSVCEKRFGSVWFLRRHFRVHTGEKPFGCSKCKKTFSQKYNLDVHLRVHTGEKPYRCSLCTQRFAQNTALIKHKQKHARENTYSC